MNINNKGEMREFGHMQAFNSEMKPGRPAAGAGRQLYNASNALWDLKHPKKPFGHRPSFYVDKYIPIYACLYIPAMTGGDATCVHSTEQWTRRPPRQQPWLGTS